MSKGQVVTVDDSINRFPPGVQAILRRMRSTFQDTIPGAQGTIRNNMPIVTPDGRPWSTSRAGGTT